MMSGMESIPIGDRHDNVVPLPGSQTGPPHAEQPGSDEPDLQPGASAPARLAGIAEDVLRIITGFVSAAAVALSRAFEHAVPDVGDDLTEPDGEPAAPGPSTLALAAGAMAELTVEVAGTAFRTMGSVSAAVRRAARER